MNVIPVTLRRSQNSARTFIMHPSLLPSWVLQISTRQEQWAFCTKYCLKIWYVTIKQLYKYLWKRNIRLKKSGNQRSKIRFGYFKSEAIRNSRFFEGAGVKYMYFDAYTVGQKLSCKMILFWRFRLFCVLIFKLQKNGCPTRS